MNLVKELLYRLRGEHSTEKLVSMGMKVGKDFKRLRGVILDPGHCSLDEYVEKEKLRIQTSPCYGEEYTLRQNVPTEKRLKQKEELTGKIGCID